MAKAYWVVCYRSISDPTARENYSKLGAPAVLAAGGRSRIATVAVYFTPEHPFIVIVPPTRPDIRQDCR